MTSTHRLRLRLAILAPLLLSNAAISNEADAIPAQTKPLRSSPPPRPAIAWCPRNTASTGWSRRSTAPRSPRKPAVRSRRSFYDVDDFVEKGEVIARLRDTEHRARLAQAAADLRSASAQLEQAREEHQRIEGLYQQKNVSESALDQAEADLESAEARLESAQANLEQAQEQLEYTQIRAPYSGIVIRRHVELGEVASPGSPVMSGISLEELRVIIDVPQSAIPAVRERGEINIYLPNGEVDRAEPHHRLPVRRSRLEHLQGARRSGGRPKGSSPGCSSRPPSSPATKKS